MLELSSCRLPLPLRKEWPIDRSSGSSSNLSKTEVACYLGVKLFDRGLASLKCLPKAPVSSFVHKRRLFPRCSEGL